MKYTKIKNTDLKVSKLMYGCSSFWARKQFSDKMAINLVHQAIGGGVNFFDTGPSYGAGLGEERLGRAISNHRSDVVISTKAGTFVSEKGKIYHDFSSTKVLKSVEESLKRLQIDYIDILFLHGPRLEHINDDLLNSLAKLREKGKVRYLGVNSFQNDVILHCLNYQIFQGYMFEYNLLNQENETLIDAVDAKGNFSISATSVARALFNPKTFVPFHLSSIWYILRTLRYQRELYNKSRNFRFLNSLPNMSGAQAAIAFVLNNPKLTSAAFGTTNLKHLSENIGAVDMELDEVLLNRIKDLA